MANTNCENFQKLWNQFITKLKGRIIKEDRRQPLDFESFEMILEDTKGCWSSSFEAGGRWLKDLSEKDSEKGKKVKKIISDMKFHRIPQKKNLWRFLVYLLPLLFGAGGYFVSTLFSSLWYVWVASAVVPAVIMLLSARLLETNIKNNLKKKQQTEYLNQLNLSFNQIINILEK